MVRQFLPMDVNPYTKRLCLCCRDDVVLACMIPTTAIITNAFHLFAFTRYEQGL